MPLPSRLSAFFALPVVALLFLVGGCDSSPSLACPELLNDGAYAQIIEPTWGDTVRLGEPFLFQARYEGGRGGEVTGGVSLEWGLPFGPTPEVLFEQALITQERFDTPYSVEQEVVIDRLPAGMSLDDFDPEVYFVVGAYTSEAYPSCPDVAGGRSSVTYSRVTVLD